jgi:hypothetical protein
VDTDEAAARTDVALEGALLGLAEHVPGGEQKTTTS